MALCWIFVVLLINYLLNCIHALDCSEQSNCYTIRPDKGPFSDQVISAANNTGNRSITILVHSGNYNATDRTAKNFVNFENVTIMKHPDDTKPATISCPEIVTEKYLYNGVGFENCFKIFVSGLSFTHCGITTSGLYFYNTTDLTITDCTFHSNLETGVQIVTGNNINLTNCHFFNNVALHNDNSSRLIGMANVNATGGVGLGAYFINQTDVTLSINNCTFTENLSYKNPSFDASGDMRPYAFIPVGNGGGVDIQTAGVNNLYARITDCHFLNNAAINQGGGLVMIAVDSVNNTLDISSCKFVGNKALGYLLRSYNGTVDKSSIKDSVQHILTKFSNIDYITTTLFNAPLDNISLSGGLGGGIAMSLYGQAVHNKLIVENTTFLDNLGIITGAIGFVVRDALSKVADGIDTNRAILTNCTFINNAALFGGTAIGIASYARVDITSQPIEINNCTFKGNRNLLPTIYSYEYGFLGAVSGIRFPVSFRGTNTFQSNHGGGVAMYHARVELRDELNFNDHYGAAFGGALRIGALTLVQLFPNTRVTFVNNSASQFGGAIAVQNYRDANDSTLILNNNCFVQYNIGCYNENGSFKWTAHFDFDGNRVTAEKGEGQAFFAEDIRNCIVPQLVRNESIDFEQSIFSVNRVFNFSDNNERDSFVTSPHFLVLGNENRTVIASPGEMFNLYLHAVDENNNVKFAIYAYPKPISPVRRVLSSGIVIDLNSSNTGFASLSKVANMTQRASFILRDSSWLEYQNCNYVQPNISYTNFVLKLIDSSNGQVVNDVNVMVKVQCCRAAYKYNSRVGKCEFEFNQNNIIRRERSSNRYVYIHSDRYAGNMTTGGSFVTAKMPPSYQNCTQEGRLSGCLVMDDDLDQQCSQGRSGFLCGSCTKQSDNKGVALSLIECVPCGPGSVVVFVFICILVVVLSMLGIYFDIGLPNVLKGFLFFIQVIGYIYRTGVANGEIEWHFYLSRFFGFSFYMPLCVSPNLSSVQVAMFGFIPPLLMAMCILAHIVLARFVVPLSKRRTVDGIWFLVLIIYVYTADTCLNLLRCVQVYEPIEFKGKRVYYFDGSLECFGRGHIQYGVIAIVVSVLFLIPFPVYVLAVSCNWLKNSGPIRDIVGTGVRPKYEWWSSYDLGRRLLFVVVYLFFEIFISEYTEFALTFTALVILIISSRVHPYKQKMANLVEWLIMLDLVLISVCFLNTEQGAHANSDHLTVLFLILPFIYYVLYVLFKIFEVFWNKWILEYDGDMSNSIEHSNQRGLSRHRTTFRKWSSNIFRSGNSMRTLSDTTTRMLEGDNSYERFRDELLADYADN